MTAHPFDPWQAEQRAIWRNRIKEWRTAPTQPVFHAAMLTILAALVIPLLVHALRTQATTITPWLRQQWWWLLPALLIALLLSHRRSQSDRLRRRSHGWLAAQPVPAEAIRRNRHAHAWMLLLLHVAAIVALALLLEAPWSLTAGAAGCAGLAALAACGWPPTDITAIAPSNGRDRARGWPGAGRLWRWQMIEVGSLFGPRRFAMLLLAWLLVPGGLQLLGALLVAGALLLLAFSVVAWHISMAVLPQAQRWLATHPIPPARLLRAWMLVPSIQLATAVGVVTLLLPRLDAAPGLVIASACGLLMVGLLQAACVAAERHRPARATLAFIIQLTLLVGVAQSLPPALLLLWPAQLIWLIRRSVHA